MSEEKKEKKQSIISIINNESQKKNMPNIKVGETVKVHTKIIEGNKERIQIFQGVVIACKGGKGANATFTVRKVSYNVGVEKTFLLHSPRIEKVEVISKGVVRRSKLYYLRDLTGKKARIKTKFFQTESGNSSDQGEETENDSEQELAKTETENTSQAVAV